MVSFVKDFSRKTFQSFSTFFRKRLDNSSRMIYNSEAVKRNAAIAQPVERILGKDEVASSNLASSSKKPGTPTSFRLSSFLHCAVTATETDTKTDTAIFSHAKIYYDRLP